MNEHPPIAVVTGGSRGLGRAVVLALAARGVRSIFTFHSNEAAAQAVVSEAAAIGTTAVALRLDTRQVKTFEQFAKDVADVLDGMGASRFDYLVNNAGTSLGKTFAQTTEADLDALYEVHFKGVFFLTQTLLPLMNDGGRIVNVSTGLTRFAMVGRAAYGAIKGAIEVLTKHLALELGPRRIAVNVVAPGAIATDFSGGIVRDNPDVNKHVAAATALGRAGVPEDVGPMIAALLSDENRWVNAQRIEVSGGMHL